MLKQIEFQNLWQFDKPKLFSVDKLTAIQGGIASGKTSFLKVLYFLKGLSIHPKRTRIEELDFEPFTYTRASSIGVEFETDYGSYNYFVEFKNTSILNETLKLNSKIVYTRQDNDLDFGSKGLNKKMQRLKFNMLENRTVLGAYNVTNVDNEILLDVRRWFSNYFMGSSVNDFINAEKVLKILQSDKWVKVRVLHELNKLGFEVINIDIRGGDKMKSEYYSYDLPDIIKDVFTHVYTGYVVYSDNRIVPFKKESKSIQRLIEVLTMLYHSIQQGSMLVIDDIDLYLPSGIVDKIKDKFIELSDDTQQFIYTKTTNDKKLVLI